MEQIDILLATYNGEKYLKEQLDSILSQTYSNFRLIISDDCSKDTTRDILKEYEQKDNRITVYYQDKNLGPALNVKFMEDKIFGKHDKYIITEDDNEVAMNFLSYMNWGLEEFKDDEDVYAICSTADFKVVTKEDDGDYMMLPAFNAYGVGHWKHKVEQCVVYLSQDVMTPIYKSMQMQEKLGEINSV